MWVSQYIQGISKKLFLGCEKSGEKVLFCLPCAYTKTQFFHTIFSQTGKSLLEIPSTMGGRMGGSSNGDGIGEVA